MKTPLLLVVILNLFFALPGLAQRELSGKVVDESGQPLPGVNIIIKGTSDGTVSDVNGEYRFPNLTPNTVLSFSFIGYVSQELTVGDRTNINIKLASDVSTLSEVIVVGYGVQKKSVATASLSKVEAKDLTGFSVPRLDQMLQGQVSGVTFKSSSGQPGSGMNIFIRGIGTNGDNSPLIVIDGMVANDGVLQSLNPNDIASAEVLKDGASTAIYGARGANGIILITTKKAKAGTATFNYSANYGTQNPWRLPTMLNSTEYIKAQREVFANDGIAIKPGFPAQADATTLNTNWFDVIFEPGVTQNHNVSLSKGTDTGNLYAALSYFDQKGVIDPSKSNVQRLTARVNSETKINEFLTFGENIFIIHQKSKRIPENNAFGSPIADAFNLDPLSPVYDGTRQFGFSQSPWVQKEYINPLSRLFITNNYNFHDGITGNVYLKITPAKNLTFRTDLGVDYNYYTSNGFTPAYHFTPAFMLKSNAVGAYEAKKYRWQWENYVNYNRTVGKHFVDLTVGTSIQERMDDAGQGVAANSNGVPYDNQLDPSFWYINSTPDSATASTWKQERLALASVFGRITYNFSEKYLVGVTMRRDASTNFGPKKQAGIFPSLSAGWVISKENFFPRDIPVDFLKLRASYGINGNDRIPSLQYRSTVEATGAYQFGKPGLQGIYTGYSSPRGYNEGVQWEQSVQTDIGVEVGLFNDQLVIEFDYYNKVTDKLLIPDQTKLTGGILPPYANLGAVSNRGFELEVKYRKSFGPVNMRLGLVASTLRNKATKLNVGYLNGYTWPVRNLVISRMELDQPIGYFRGRQTAGIFQTQNEVFSYINSEGDPIQPNAKPGDFRFVDINHDGKIDDNDVAKIGKPWPDFTYGINLGLDYKGFDFRILVSGAMGNQIYRTYERNDVQYANLQTTWLDRWTPENPGAKYPRLTFVDANGNNKPSDFYVSSGAYARVKNLQIGYTIPRSLLDAAKMTNFRIYLSSDNLLTITPYKGYDPEIGVGNGVLDVGIDKGYYPQMRAFTVGLSASF